MGAIIKNNRNLTIVSTYGTPVYTGNDILSWEETSASSVEQSEVMQNGDVVHYITRSKAGTGTITTPKGSKLHTMLKAALTNGVFVGRAYYFDASDGANVQEAASYGEFIIKLDSNPSSGTGAEEMSYTISYKNKKTTLGG